MKPSHWLLASLLVSASHVPESFAQQPPTPPLALVTQPHPTAKSATTPNGSSTDPSFAPDGGWLAFISDATTLVTNHVLKPSQFPFVNVFLRDLSSGDVSLISVEASGTRSGNGHSYNPQVTQNALAVVFESTADSLVDHDANQASDLFVRTRADGRTRLISVNRAGQGSGNGASTDARVTPDGRFVAFISQASDLVDNDLNGISDVFVRDLQTGQTRQVSVGARPGKTGIGDCSSPTISDDGRWVAFSSTAVGLHPDVTNHTSQVYLCDLSSQTVRWISQIPPHLLPEGSLCFAPILSSNGSTIVFKSFLKTNSRTMTSLFWFDHLSGQLNLVDSDLAATSPGLADDHEPVLSANGQVVCYVARDPLSDSQVYVWNSTSRRPILVSANHTRSTTGKGRSFAPSMDAAGNQVAFASTATDLTQSPANGSAQIYLRDLRNLTSPPTLIYPTLTPASMLDSGSPTISRDGSKLAFQSEIADTIGEDLNQAHDVLVLTLDTLTLQRVSQRAPNVPKDATPSHPSLLEGLTRQGNRVLFSSLAPNLIPGTAYDRFRAFSRGISSSSTSNPDLSPVLNPQLTNTPISSIITSGDGRFAAFSSPSQELSPLATNNFSNVYRVDLSNGNLSLVSVNAAKTESGNAASTPIGISADGRFVLFTSSASNLLQPGSTAGFGVRLLLRDLLNETTSLLGSGNPAPTVVTTDTACAFQFRGPFNISVHTYGSTTTDSSFIPQTGTTLQGLSPDARWISLTRNLGTGFSLELYDLQTRTTRSITSERAADPANPSGPTPPAFSQDSRFLVFSDSSATLVANDSNNAVDVFRVSLESGQIELVSLSSKTPPSSGAGPSDQPRMSGDGRFVVFRSSAPDLTAHSPAFGSQIFVRDVATGTTRLLSRSLDGTPGNGFSGNPWISQDGSAIVFQSAADNLVAADHNNATDIFFVLRQDPAGQPRLLFHRSVDGRFQLSWPAPASNPPVLQYSAAIHPATWNDFPGPVTLDPGSSSAAAVVDFGTPARFYRLRPSP